MGVSMSGKIAIPRSSDKAVASFFSSIGNSLGLSIFSCMRFGEGSSQEIKINEIPDFLLNNDIFSIIDASLSYNNFSINFSRKKGNDGSSFAFDSLSIENRYGQNLTQKQITDINLAIKKYFIGKLNISAAIAGDVESNRNLISEHHNIVLRLENSLRA